MLSNLVIALVLHEESMLLALNILSIIDLRKRTNIPSKIQLIRYDAALPVNIPYQIPYMCGADNNTPRGIIYTQMLIITIVKRYGFFLHIGLLNRLCMFTWCKKAPIFVT